MIPLECDASISEEVGHAYMCGLRNILRKFRLFCVRHGMVKLLLTPKGNDSNYRFLLLVLQVNLLCLQGRQLFRFY